MHLFVFTKLFEVGKCQFDFSQYNWASNHASPTTYLFPLEKNVTVEVEISFYCWHPMVAIPTPLNCTYAADGVEYMHTIL